MVALIISLLDSTSQAYLTWIRIYDPDNARRGSDFRRTLSEVPAPLYYACHAGLFEVVQYLVDKGAEVNAAGGRYGNALQAAS
ncbi:hypothetical protein DL95DRAFT_310998, partial [Leptodontidium sp. 2 PMI_412]